MKPLLFSIVCLSVLGIVFLGRFLYNRSEIKRLERNGYRRIAKPSALRGHVEDGFLMCLVQLGAIILLLLAVFGWMGLADPRW